MTNSISRAGRNTKQN